MELNDTAEMMGSADYKERFKAEYWQTKIRYEKLKNLTTKMEASKAMDKDYKDYLGFEPTCPYNVLREQQKDMGIYLHDLELRAVIEGVDLGEAK